MLLYKKQIKPVIKSYCLLRVYEQTGMSFSLLANNQTTSVISVMSTDSNLCCWDLHIFQCISTNPFGTTS